MIVWRGQSLLFHISVMAVPCRSFNCLSEFAWLLLLFNSLRLSVTVWCDQSGCFWALVWVPEPMLTHHQRLVRYVKHSIHVHLKSVFSKWSKCCLGFNELIIWLLKLWVMSFVTCVFIMFRLFFHFNITLTIIYNHVSICYVSVPLVRIPIELFFLYIKAI